jgi:uncharacterized membrane protein YhaH (DUF805 family)
MIGWMILPLQRSLDFRGRSCRREYWSFVLLQLIVFLTALGIAFSLPVITDKPGAVVWAPIIHLLVFGLPALAVQVRRLHDQDKSGWWVIVGAVPYLGVGFILWLMVQAGTWGPNRFGPDPRHRWEGDLFE